MISVVVPVYNCERYLNESLQSLISQTIFDQLEIIVVDDGSTDNSWDVVRQFDDSYSNFYCYKMEHMGVSAARNLGVQKASGEYIAFFDADDIAKPFLYEKLLKIMEVNDADITVVDYSMVFDGYVEKKHRKSFVKKLSGYGIIKDYLYNNNICSNSVDKLYRTDMVKEVQFPEGYAIGEDEYFVYHMLKKSHSIVIDSTESLYLYQIRSDSAMQQKFSPENFDAVKLSKLIWKDVEEVDMLSNYAEANYIHEICKMLAVFYRSDIDRELFDELITYEKDLEHYSIIKAMKYMNFKHFNGFMLMKLSPLLYLKIHKAMKIG